MEHCDNYDICQKYALYGKCERECNNELSEVNSFCDVYQKQIITILASIDEKLEKLLDTKMGT